MNNTGEEIAYSISCIVSDYLWKIASCGNHEHFSKTIDISSKKSGFYLLNQQCENEYVIREEAFFEGCTRVFLINPIMKLLLDYHGIKNDWRFGDTFENFTITNREYENGNFIEFIATIDGKRVGIRYTPSQYSSTEYLFMKRDADYLFKDQEIPGFEFINKIDELWFLDWNVIPGDKSFDSHLNINRSNTKVISVEQFFSKCFSLSVYEIFVKKTKEAVSKAKDIIALKAFPLLLPNNILKFKEVALQVFDVDHVKNLHYSFGQSHEKEIGLSTEDIGVLNLYFFEKKYRNAIIGNSSFAESFITSEYLFRMMKQNVCIDYTAIVVGYLKAVEQLLYLIYVSAFQGHKELDYWDTCHKVDHFNLNDSKYRINPYNVKDKEKKQEKYTHAKTKPELGELIRFLRYFESIWRVSESGKEYIISCLEDFRKYCRNSHFHKENITKSQYKKVNTIRNNACVCIYYLIGGFEIYSPNSSVEDRLGIVDYSFDCLYNKIRNRTSKYYCVVDNKDDREEVVIYLNNDEAYLNEEGFLGASSKIQFLRTNMSLINYDDEKALSLLNDPEYVKNNLLSLTVNNMHNYSIKRFSPKKRVLMEL